MARTRLATLLLGVSAWACNSSEAPAVPTTLEKSGGDAQNWYFNNALPAPFSVTVRDASGHPVSNVKIGWREVVGDGTLSDDTTTTGPNGVATTSLALGLSTLDVVIATVSGLPSVAFMAHASAPPTTADVSVTNNAFTADSVVVQTLGTVTWTWNSGAVEHNVTYTSGPTPLPTSSLTQPTPYTFSTTFTNVGTYAYHCTIFPTQMNGKVIVVH